MGSDSIWGSEAYIGKIASVLEVFHHVYQSAVSGCYGVEHTGCWETTSEAGASMGCC